MNFFATVERCNGYTLQYIQCCTSSVATASVDCHVCQFISGRTRKITSSAVGNFLVEIFLYRQMHGYHAILLVLVLFPLVNMLIKQAMSTSRYHIKFKNRQKQY